MTGSKAIVEMEGISIEFPGVKALDDVKFRMYPGEVHTLMGENGAGKSTLIKALTGVYAIDSGSIRIDGEEHLLHGSADAQRAGISTVYQEVNLCTNLTIGENVMLGYERRGTFGIDWNSTYAAASVELEKLGLGHLNPRRPLSTLSIALQQLVAISRAMVIDSKVLILDEPTSSLDAKEVENLFVIIRRLRDAGVAILFVSHFIDQVFAISDRLTVLRNGQYVGEYMTSDIDRTKLISAMIGKDVKTFRGSGSHVSSTGAAEQDESIIETQDLGRKGAIEPTSISLSKGKVTGFAGLLGSGRTELARLLYGADKADSGTISLHGKKVDISSPAVALANRIAFSSENRRDEGVIGGLTVRENITLAVQAKRGWARPLSKREEREIVDKYMALMNVRPADPELLIKNLSGGNQQKVLLGRWLATHPEVLILDEPTRGIDIGAKAEIEATVSALAEDGVTVVFISSELEEVARLCDRIIVLKDHQLIADIDNNDTVTSDVIVGIIAEHGAAA